MRSRSLAAEPLHGDCCLCPSGVLGSGQRLGPGSLCQEGEEELF